MSEDAPVVTQRMRMLARELAHALFREHLDGTDTRGQTTQYVVFLEFNQVVSDVDSAASEAIRSTLLSAFCAGIADEFTTINDRAGPPHSSVPDELWASIWSELDLEDRTGVTHVCRMWRRTALAAPRLWSHIRFSSNVHATMCRCIACGRPYGNARARLNRKTKLEHIRFLLSRAQALPLTLELRLVPWKDDWDSYRHEAGRLGYGAPSSDLTCLEPLVEFLKPHTDRIISLVITTACPTAKPLQCFLNKLGALPQLTSFASHFVDMNPDLSRSLFGARPDSSPLVAADIFRSMPALRSVALLPPPVNIPFDKTSPFAMASVRAIAMAISSDEDVLELSNRFPNLRSANLTINGDNFHWRRQDPVSPVSLELQFEHLQLLQVPPAGANNPYLAALMASDVSGDYTIQFQRDFPKRSDFSIFRRLRGDLALTMEFHKGGVTLCARELAAPAGAIGTDAIRRAQTMSFRGSGQFEDLTFLDTDPAWGGFSLSSVKDLEVTVKEGSNAIRVLDNKVFSSALHFRLNTLSGDSTISLYGRLRPCKWSALAPNATSVYWYAPHTVDSQQWEDAESLDAHLRTISSPDCECWESEPPHGPEPCPPRRQTAYSAGI
jgi:hypothetical protein